MRVERIGNATLYCADMQVLLPTLGRFDALVTDPPYGIGKLMSGVGGTSYDWGVALKKMKDWDTHAPHDLVNAARAQCEHAVIWGGNYFDLPPSRMYLVWAKGAGMYRRDFAECEQAWCSWDASPRLIEFAPETHAGKIKKQHPTQKPLRLMHWCIDKLPKGCKTIFDPFMGSGTTGIAALAAGMEFVGVERDPEYFEVACSRIRESLRQVALFEPA
jgi:DNA modification methylase